MQAMVLREVKSRLDLHEREPLQPGEGQVVVELAAAALNRRDYWITQGMYPGIQTPVVLGSDGAGVVTAIGPAAESRWADAEVIINPGLNWGDRQRHQSEAFQILGMPRDGTFAEQVVIEQAYLHKKPDHLDWYQAAALPLAGLTAYRAVCFQGQLEAGQTVLVTGVGGGVAGFAVQFAVASGARVLVTSSSEAKIDRARQLGAVAGFDYNSEGWHDRLLKEFGPVDLIIDSAAGAGYAALVKIAAFGGRIVNYGATTGSPPKFDIFSVFWKQLTLQGTTMGSPDDFAGMLDFVSRHKIVPIVGEVLPLAAANDLLERMSEGAQFGKLVLEVKG